MEPGKVKLSGGLASFTYLFLMRCVWGYATSLPPHGAAVKPPRDKGRS